LLSNAVKYTPDNGTVTVSTSLRDTDRRGKKVKKQFIEIQIKDTGFGIPSNQQEKIFSKMFRAENAKKNVPEGNGLGLYLVKAIVEHVGGDIWFESEEGSGTTFYILLPIDGMKPHKKRSK
jgi:signal transduction histidine kinase